MQELEVSRVECPYCGESFEALLDNSVSQQAYIEDCQVCCRPINFNVTVDLDGTVSVSVTHENE